MKSKIKIKNIIVMTVIGIISLFFMNVSLAVNTAKINVETANLRETADANAKILELLPMNEEVEVIEKTGDWYKVKAKGIIGYLRQDIITVNETIEVSAQNQEVTQPEQTTESEETSQTETTESGETSQTESTEKSEEETPQQEQTVPIEEIKLGKQKIAEDTRLKIVPVINATDTIEVKKEQEVNVIEIVNGWVCVEVETTKGWIRKEKIQKEEQPTQESTQPTQEPVQESQPQPQQPTAQAVSKTLYINTASARLRKDASTSADIIMTVSANTAVEVKAEIGEWSQVKVSGKEGYILSSLLSTTKQETSRSATTPRKTSTDTTEKTETATTTKTASEPSQKGGTVVATAKQYIGCKYVYGGNSPSGFDCSGFTSYVYKQYGVSLNRTASGQYSNGVAVNRSDLQPGDLVMFGKSGINHVGIYVGGGQIVHAANSSRGVTTDTINSGYYNKTYKGARRVMQ